MFFAVSKALAWAAAPPAWCSALLAAAFVVRRRMAVAATLVALAASVPFVFSSPAVAATLHEWAETGARDTSRRDARYDAVVVLGGDVEGPRIEGGAEALRSGRAEFLLYTGVLGPRRAAELVARLRALGVRGDRIVLEGRSRNTHENAVESARLVRERGWRSLLLVTSAAHAGRALRCFRAAGLDPDLLPVDYASRALRTQGWRPRSGVLGASTAALHELLGGPVYRAMGYVD